MTTCKIYGTNPTPCIGEVGLLWRAGPSGECKIEPRRAIKINGSANKSGAFSAHLLGVKCHQMLPC